MDMDTFWNDFQLVRTGNPLVLNVTNHVVTNNTANALLAAGASPIMTFSSREVEDLMKISGALVINIGTLNTQDIGLMHAAWSSANAMRVPVVFDPVGAGASTLRTSSSQELLSLYRPDIIRGNASEIMTLAGEAGQAKGVDSSLGADAAVAAARALAQMHSCTTVVSGEVDIVTDGNHVYRVNGGHALMPRVTGLGCTATAICGAFLAVNRNRNEAAVDAMALMAIAGGMAGAMAQGPGSLQMHFYDMLYSLKKSDAERLFSVTRD
ncbi:hydroxyethylthiazole kinase [Pseudodesulfovibrio tunisiensis]|uniref:hydroxyethylthiazole kinase n=1 Tax=Pseudodesulfovibrio tunisiensis TaxID=463192 RepID=UPI001FB4F1B4|nr:hydroxyethylthiazole kinase [Pseudodesulfovibrio tunisiensis]